MTTYMIVNMDSGLVLGYYQGNTKEEALDAMARDAGYKDRADATAQVGDGAEHLVVREVEAPIA